MSSVQCWFCGKEGMLPDPDGNWVAYNDYAALETAITLYIARAGGMQTGDRWTSRNAHHLADLLAALAAVSAEDVHDS